MMRVIPIGVTALREPDGTPMKSITMYVDADEAQAAGLVPMPEKETAASCDVAGLFTAKHKAYIQAVKAAERETKSRPRRTLAERAGL
jgi:hypothetical protein